MEEDAGEDTLGSVVVLEENIVVQQEENEEEEEEEEGGQSEKNNNNDDNDDDFDEEEEEDDDDIMQYRAIVAGNTNPVDFSSDHLVPAFDRFALHRWVEEGNVDMLALEITQRGGVESDCTKLDELVLEKSPLIHVVLSVAELNVEFALACLTLLLEQNSKHAEQMDEYFRTPLRLALEFNLDRRILLLLLPFGHLGRKDSVLKWNALHAGARFAGDFVSTLLDASEEEDMNALDEEHGRTFLHWLCIAHPDCVTDALIAQFQQRGGDVHVIDTLGNRCMDYVHTPRGGDGVVRPCLVYHHPLCMEHHTCDSRLTEAAPYIRARNAPIPPENVNRLRMLLDAQFGSLRGVANVEFRSDFNPAPLADVLRVHDWSYVLKLQMSCQELAHDELGDLDGDTGFSKRSFDASLVASGALLDAVDSVVSGKARNAFCAVRPPGHHAGPVGITRGCNSHGFCLLNNVAIASSYAMHVHRHTIKRVAIVDFDVHHGNGTEACVDQLEPSVQQLMRHSFGPHMNVSVTMPTFKPWLNQDQDNVLFCSVHGFGGNFYPNTGPSESSRRGVLNVAQRTKSRLEWRQAWANQVLPSVDAFKPDLILISAGFDAHEKDDINCGLCGTIEHDYFWLTEKLVGLANVHCPGRIVSALEGGYRIHGMLVSAFSRSVREHVRALASVWAGGREQDLGPVSSWKIPELNQDTDELFDEETRKRLRVSEEKLDGL